MNLLTKKTPTGRRFKLVYRFLNKARVKPFCKVISLKVILFMFSDDLHIVQFTSIICLQAFALADKTDATAIWDAVALGLY